MASKTSSASRVIRPPLVKGEGLTPTHEVTRRGCSARIRSTDSTAVCGSSDRRGSGSQDPAVAIAPQGVASEGGPETVQHDAACRVAGHVHHVPPGHGIAVA
ncbi:MAG: hypothetical protein WCF04_03860 [Candidatus Nanopelagicales bacterium]